MESDQSNPSIAIVIKSPNSSDFLIRFPLQLTVGELKSRLSLAHPLTPNPAQQRLIFAGRILSDMERLSEVFRSDMVRPFLLSSATSSGFLLSFLAILLVEGDAIPKEKTELHIMLDLNSHTHENCACGSFYSFSSYFVFSTTFQKSKRFT